MTRAYSEDLRSRVIKEINKGTSCRRAAALYGIGPSAGGRQETIERCRREGIDVRGLQVSAIGC